MNIFKFQNSSDYLGFLIEFQKVKRAANSILGGRHFVLQFKEGDFFFHKTLPMDIVQDGCGKLSQESEKPPKKEK